MSTIFKTVNNLCTTNYETLYIIPFKGHSVKNSKQIILRRNIKNWINDGNYVI
jgi:hypothetical protein